MGSEGSSWRLKAQVSAITVIVLAGIGVSLGMTAYMWGLPLIEKRATITDYFVALDFIKRLDSKIVSIANSQAGEESLDIPKGLVTIVPYDADNPDNNSILLEFLEPQPMILDASVYVDTNVLGEIATYGEAEPRVIIFTGERLETRRNKFTLRLHYRELDTETTPVKGYQIMLNDLTLTGTNRITVSFDETRSENPETVPNGAANNGDLFLTYVSILLE